jgi:uncharacterized membrane protein SpoIIM required for sporulation
MSSNSTKHKSKLVRNNTITLFRLKLKKENELSATLIIITLIVIILTLIILIVLNDGVVNSVSKRRLNL